MKNKYHEEAFKHLLVRIERENQLKKNNNVIRGFPENGGKVVNNVIKGFPEKRNIE